VKQAVKEFDVLRKVEAKKSFKDGSVIFQDFNGRIMFIDKKHPEYYENINVGDILFVWVTKHLDKVSFVKLTIDGLFIKDYMVRLIGLTPLDYKKTDHKESFDITMLYNYLNNHDSNYKKFVVSVMNGNLHMVSNYTFTTLLSEIRYTIPSNDQEINYHQKLFIDGYLCYYKQHVVDNKGL